MKESHATDRVPVPALGADAGCPVPAEHDPEVTRAVHQACADHGVSSKVRLAAFEAGWVESHMNNLPCGDKDSVGVFQQRPSQGWGTAEQCGDVPHATASFLRRAVEEDRRDPGRTAGEIAQAVQRSAFPERYDQAETKARSLIEEAGEATDS
ncbi:hypothetical protein GPA10_32950 [Streptomyces sp. p1417]|uniref:Uncharacterized protein n=1 Tax=Streptomyces typhae TaxID=2681492 RepID=A0A6L6X6K1_9ACTN|nr:hypothetical protein [Streptomyces typhae]MVO89432.1 hypothetical protein [Streptomyces typhae]